MSAASSTQPQTQQRQPRTFAEWVTFSVALAILLGVIGLIGFNWLATPQTPPIIHAQLGELRAEQGQFYVPFTVENTGQSTAEMVQVIAELAVNGSVVEDGEQHIDFLAGGETAEGMFVFGHDPRAGELKLRVASFQMP